LSKKRTTKLADKVERMEEDVLQRAENTQLSIGSATYALTIVGHRSELRGPRILFAKKVVPPTLSIFKLKINQNRQKNNKIERNCYE
jgi:hypothetical protein